MIDQIFFLLIERWGGFGVFCVLKTASPDYLCTQPELGAEAKQYLCLWIGRSLLRFALLIASGVLLKQAVFKVTEGKFTTCVSSVNLIGTLDPLRCGGEWREGWLGMHRNVGVYEQERAAVSLQGHNWRLPASSPVSESLHLIPSLKKSLGYEFYFIITLKVKDTL